MTQDEQHPTRIKIKSRTTRNEQQEPEQQPEQTTTKLKLRVKPPQQQQQPTHTPTTSHPTPQQINQIRSHGTQIWNQIVNTADPSGRVMSFQFMDLPSMMYYPDYYQIIKHPIALNLIKAKLDSERDPYLSFEHLRSDLKRVFNNAKKYNLEDSEIFKDAKTLLKIVRKAPSPGNTDDHSNQSEPSEPKQKKLKLNFKLQPPSNATNSTPATVIIPPSPINASHNQPENHPHARPQPQNTQPQQETRGMSDQEIARIQAELIAQTEARTRAREQARQSELRNQEQARKEDQDRQNNLRLQAQAHQVQLREQDQAQMLTTATPGLSSTAGIEPQISQAQSSGSVPTQEPLSHRSPTRSQARLSLQIHQSQPNPTQQLPDRSSPPSKHVTTVPIPFSPPKSTLHKTNAIKLKLWFKVILENLESITDRTGRKLIEEFLTLPDKTRWKTYYQIIPEPIAFDNIQARNNRQGYKEFEPFKNDVLKIFRNAQHFNEDGSMVWNDSQVLQAKFLELIQHPPPDLADLVLPFVSAIDLEMLNEARPVTPPSSMNGLGKRKERRTPSKQMTTSSSNLVAPTATVGLRRSSRSPSRPSPGRGSPISRLSSRPVSPLPRRVTSPVPATGPGGALNQGLSRTSNNHNIVVPPQLPTSALRSASRLANDISPALLSISSANHNLSAANNNNALNHFLHASLTSGPRIRSLPPIPVKVSDSHPPMMTRFKISTRPKTMENLRIMNQQVFQHGFQVPRMTKMVIIETEVNKSWPSTRQLRSSDRLGAIKVKIESIRIQGKFHETFNPFFFNQDYFINNTNNAINIKEKEKEKEKENGLVSIEVDLIDGMNVIEYTLIGKTNDNSISNNNTSNGGGNLNDSVNGVLLNNNSPSTTTVTNNNNPTVITPTSTPNSSFKLFKESYRLFIYR